MVFDHVARPRRLAEFALVDRDHVDDVACDVDGMVGEAFEEAACEGDVDGFFDAAWAHDPGFGRGLRNYSGIGGALEAPAPFGTLLALEWGYGFRGVNSNGSLGTQVVRVSAVKVF